MNLVRKALAFIAEYEQQIQRLAPITAGMFAGVLLMAIMGWMMLTAPGSPESVQLEIVKWLGIFGCGMVVNIFVSQIVHWGLIRTIGKIKGKAGLVEVEIDTSSTTTTETQVNTQISEAVDGEEV